VERGGLGRKEGKEAVALRRQQHEATAGAGAAGVRGKK